MPMKSRRCVLRGQTIDSLDQFYQQIAAALSFPAYFGRNLDALWDVLARDLEGPIEIVWEEAGRSKAHMGEDFEKVMRVLKKAEEKRGDFTVTLLNVD